MKIIDDPKELQNFCLSFSGTIGFVPTMGALHAGHMSLIEQSKQQNDLSIVSIFVNSTQFQKKDDLDKYPRTLESDKALLDAAGVDVLFLPDFASIYPDNYTIKVTESDISGILDGASRPGYFDGIQTVVLKLLNLTQATNSYFGEKDFQQCLIVEKMVKSFFLPTTIHRGSTLRESDGLAMASRNLRLSESGRKLASKMIEPVRSQPDIQLAKKQLTDLGFEVDYLEDHFNRRFIACYLEGVRLIDNIAWPPQSTKSQ